MKKELTVLFSGLIATIIIFTSAVAIGLAGRVHAEEGKVDRLENTTFMNNTAGTGGAIDRHGENNTDIPFKDNTAGTGGAVMALGPDPNFHTSFMNNKAETGGAISWNGEDNPDIPFTNNTAGRGGAIFVG